MSIPSTTATRRRPVSILLGAVAALGLMLGIAGPASALPPGGAATHDTPGTSSSVSPSTIEPGGTLHFTLRGYPAGEVVSVKIDEGNASSGDQSVQGQGVIHTQKIPSNGTVSGSFVLPSLSNGSHTLRFLATKPVPGKGSKGYTNKSPAFTVSQSAARSGGNSRSSSSSSSNAGTRNTTSERIVTLQRPGQQAAQPGVAQAAQPGVQAAQPGMVSGAQPGQAMPQAQVSAPASAPAATIQPSKDPAQESAQAKASQEAADQESKQAEASSKDAQELVDAKASVKALQADRADHQHGFPWLGTIAMVVVALLLIAATWFIARRSGRGTHEA